LVIDMNIDVSVSPLGRFESRIDALGYIKWTTSRVTGHF
jgi:hypothetical protein